jgi:Domain of unknown function (DUF4922)
MSWDKRFLRAGEMLPYGLPRGPESQLMPLRVQALLAQQRATWPQLQKAVAGLQDVQTRAHQLGAARFLTQFNPGRMVSTAAKVDQAAIAARPCFLCEANLPAEEKALAFGDDYAIVCNPFPVLPQHLVIAHCEHRPQAIETHFGDMLDLSQTLGDEFFTLYNGPRCGASAPDHLHFQACRYDDLPFFANLAEWEVEPVEDSDAHVSYTLPDYPFHVLVAESDDRAALVEWFHRACATLAQVTNVEDEPLLNVLCAIDEECWMVVLFARRAHRPAVYFAEGDAQLLVSPAALDLGGVTVVPHPAHFERLDAATLQSIIKEVTLSDGQFQQWMKALQA